MVSQLDVRPSKRLGQNFLCSSATARLVAEEALQDDPACIVEIGPGLGSITRFLTERSSPVVAVEVDRRLAEYLSQEFAGCPSVEIRVGDALEADLGALAALHADRLTVVGSIPYSITAPILKRVISERAVIRKAVLVTHREVAEKIAASPGKEGSPLGVYVQAYADVELLRRIPRGAFFPVPDVDSTMWSLRLGRPPRFEAPEAAFFAVVRALYGARRKTARNALQRIVSADAAEAALRSAGVDGGRRGETLGFPELDAIARAVESESNAWNSGVEVSQEAEADS